MDINKSAAILLLIRIKKRREKQRRWWVHPINSDRLVKGAYSTLVPQLEVLFLAFKFFKFYLCIEPSRKVLQLFPNGPEFVQKTPLLFKRKVCTRIILI